MTEPHLGESLSRDALRVWLDFWELTGAMRVDIIRKATDGGDASMMIAPEITITTISGVRAILIGGNPGYANDRAGELPTGLYKVELIDPVHLSDVLSFGGIEYPVEKVTEKNMGEFSVWSVEVRKVK